MESLFEDSVKAEKVIDLKLIPLAERLRPKKLVEVLGQEHLIGAGKILSKYVESNSFPSIILWGPPGIGKTTIANCLANELSYSYQSLSAVESGVKELRQVIASAELKQKKGLKTLLFIDEIHRFSKSQQDALLHSVEKGIITLVGATTENPSFEVNSALLSRMRVYKLSSLSQQNLEGLLYRAINEDLILKQYTFETDDISKIAALSSGDARTALNILEATISYADPNHKIHLNNEIIESILNQKMLLYDKNGENHYDVISAFIKSMRGSDPDAALLWLVRMLEAGEDPKFIARRMVVFASEDIGNADSSALSVAISVFRACEIIGMPECRINLAHGVTYLASTAKSNASYQALDNAYLAMKNATDLTVPLKLRNAPTRLMKNENYGKDYKYPHNFENHFVIEDYFPEGVSRQVFYKPNEIGLEKKIKERLERLWGNYKYKEQ
ncbi:MAG TPA: replication-associated recombination protein A [Candidatus Kapabacteria bacterium]|nr:replication-associated recombination protein A [Candidatus Kapabacteria bacterium]